MQSPKKEVATKHQILKHAEDIEDKTSNYDLHDCNPYLT